jgi:hypothetical protein
VVASVGADDCTDYLSSIHPFYTTNFNDGRLRGRSTCPDRSLFVTRKAHASANAAGAIKSLPGGPVGAPAC